jgi:hypothetical protein
MTLGQVAYEAYFNYTSGKSLVSGAKLPTWDELSPAIAAAWEAAGIATVDYVTEDGDGDLR